MALKLEDVARSAGVSRSTVSRVINDAEGVKEETRQRILEVIQKLNFQPNLAARGLASGRANVIGLVIPSFSTKIFTEPYFLLLLQGVSKACNERGYSVMFWLAEAEYEQRMIRQILHNGLVDGVIISSTRLGDPVVSSLHASRIPMILIGRHPTLEVNFVDVDNVQAGAQATRHLLSCGHTRVAAITGPQDTVVGADRFKGYQAALAEAGIPFQADLVVEGDFSEAGGYAAMQKLLPARPQAVFSASDMTAVGAMRALREAGLQVPGDVALVGCDDIPDAARLTPALSTIRQPIEQMGALAVSTLVENLQNGSAPVRRQILPTELVVRASTGAAA
jgi:LacI family transcriptional regulator